MNTLDAAGRQRNRRLDLAQAGTIRVPDDVLWCWVCWRAGPEPAQLDF